MEIRDGAIMLKNSRKFFNQSGTYLFIKKHHTQ